jgi:hypothetical protein
MPPEILFPICSHFLGSRGSKRDSQVLTGPEIVGVLKQIVCSWGATTPCHAGGREFESRRSRQITANITGELGSTDSPVFVLRGSQAFKGHHGEMDGITGY